MEVTIERVLPGGLGLAHAEGQTVMVALAAPGDRLRVRVDRVKGNVAFASIAEVIERSPVRVEPPCPYFGRCGGCDFQQLRYDAQLAAKKEIVLDCLRRIGKIEDVPDFEIVPSPNQWHYRARAQWQHDAVRKRLGYFEAASRRVCDVVECAVLAPELQRTLESLRAQMQDGSLPEEARDFRAIAGDEAVSVAPSANSRDRSVELREVSRTIRGETYHLNAQSFFQTNADLIPQLIDAALRDAHGEKAVELYCGVGLLTLPLARRFKHVIGVESHPTAAIFAQTNLTHAAMTNAVIANKDVADWLEENANSSSLTEERRQKAEMQTPVDFLLLDPPRTGAESRVITSIVNLRPRRISYVSCDPATLARDLKKLIAGGYAIDSLVAFDMFPQTHHVETLVHLSSQDPKADAP